MKKAGKLMAKGDHWVLYYERAPRGFGKEMPKAIAEALHEVGVHWHRHLLKRHFVRQAFLRYGGVYRPRTARYEQRKFRKYGHKDPLVWTGTLRRTLLSSAYIRATSKSLRVRMQGPKWLKGFMRFRGRAGTGPDMLKEVKAISRQEAEGFARMIGKRVKGRWARMGGVPKRQLV